MLEELEKRGREKALHVYKAIHEKLKDPTDFSLGRKSGIVYIDLVYAFTQFRPISEIRVVIVGQDPGDYPKLSCGIAFLADIDDRAAVNVMLNAMKEAIEDHNKKLKKADPKWIDFAMPQTGNFTKWCAGGVFLMNEALTVQVEDKEQKKEKQNHRAVWSPITRAITKWIAKHKKHVVFMLWGKNAKELEGHIQETQNYEEKVLGQDWNNYPCGQHSIHLSYHPNVEGYDNNLTFKGGQHFVMAWKFQKEKKVKLTVWNLGRAAEDGVADVTQGVKKM